jgi:hypothetical protein
VPVGCQSGGTSLEVVLFREASSAARCVVTCHLQQVRTHRVEAVVPCQPAVGIERLEQVESSLRVPHSGLYAKRTVRSHPSFSLVRGWTVGTALLHSGPGAHMGLHLSFVFYLQMSAF